MKTQANKKDALAAILFVALSLFFVSKMIGCADDTSATSADMYEKCLDTMQDTTTCTNTVDLYH